MAPMWAVLLLLAAASSSGHREGVTPVQKVITLLHGMVEKGKAEKQEEAVMFAEYGQWCSDTTGEKQRAVAAANSALEQLAAAVQMDEASADELGREMTGLDGEVATARGDLKAASDVRGKEAEDYRLTHQDYSESLDALERAVAVLRKQAHDRTQAGAALAQVELSRLVPQEARRVITAFLAQGDAVEQNPLDVSAPEANAYEFQSTGVVDMLEKLKDKFVDERNDLEREEMEAKHAHQMLAQDLTEQVKAATQDRTRKAQAKAQFLQAAAGAKGEASDTTATRDSDAQFLQDTSSTCKVKASDFEARQQLRTEELEALDKAITVLSSGTVSGAAEKHLPALAQVSFALRRSASRTAQERVAVYLRRVGEQVHSNVLLAVAQKATEDPFGKVKKMIKDLIVRLMEEANEEAEHKGWCDTELKTNAVTRNAKTAQVETLHARIEQLQAVLQKQAQELSDTSAEIQELSAAVAEATAQRTKQKALNEVTITEAQQAQVAVAQAVEVLKDFYAGAGDAALVQGAQPATFDGPYTGMQGESGGVVGMLEVIQSDFGRLEAETSASEEEASRSHAKLLSESAVNKARLQKDVEHLGRKRTERESDLNEATGDLSGAQEELDAALAYYEKLKPSCVDAGVTYEDRVGRRKEEIESLQEALRIMNGEDLA